MNYNITKLASKFRYAIDAAWVAGEFYKDIVFCNFPRGCCGDASDLLSQFLLESGIKTCQVCGTYEDQSHAWLMTEGHTIIDITGDQFRNNPVFLYYDKSVYVGAEDKFHRLFAEEDRKIYTTCGLVDLGYQPRLKGLYQKIAEFL